MKKGRLLNSELSGVIASLGHTDCLVIADAGLPVPKGVRRIDLALHAGTPTFLETLETVLSELCVERAVLAQELSERPLVGPIVDLLARSELGSGCRNEVQFVPHAELKKLTENAVAIVRTGECTPYANVLLYSGVTF